MTFGICRAGPTHFGTSSPAASPWLNLAVYTAMAAGPISLMLVKGQRLWRLPPFLQDCHCATVWLWSGAGKGSPVTAEADHLLWTLNVHLSSSALIVQPQHTPVKVHLKMCLASSLVLVCTTLIPLTRSAGGARDH